MKLLNNKKGEIWFLCSEYFPISLPLSPFFLSFSYVMETEFWKQLLLLKSGVMKVYYPWPKRQYAHERTLAVIKRKKSNSQCYKSQKRWEWIVDQNQKVKPKFQNTITFWGFDERTGVWCWRVVNLLKNRVEFNGVAKACIQYL